MPPGIIANDILPAARKDPASITRRGLKVLDSSGREVDPASVDWSRFRSGHIPYTLRQDPGPNNALGRVKLMFPNPYLVYLHDTPSQTLFGRWNESDDNLDETSPDPMAEATITKSAEAGFGLGIERHESLDLELGHAPLDGSRAFRPVRGVAESEFFAGSAELLHPLSRPFGGRGTGSVGLRLLSGRAGGGVGARAEIDERLNRVRSPFRTAETFGIEDLIDPRETRPLLCEWANLVAPVRKPGRYQFGYRP